VDFADDRAKTETGIATARIAKVRTMAIRCFGMIPHKGIIKVPWIIRPKKTRYPKRYIPTATGFRSTVRKGIFGGIRCRAAL
jgi:hypothetical protein